MADEFTPWRNLDAQLGNLAENFTNLIKAAKIPDETTEDYGGSSGKRVPGDLLDVWGEKMLFSAVMCQHHLSELKKASALSDFTGQLEEGRGVRTALTRADNQVSSELASIRMEAELLLHGLEESYYSSRHRGRPTSAPVSEQLRQLCQLAAETHTLPPGS